MNYNAGVGSSNSDLNRNSLSVALKRKWQLIPNKIINLYQLCVIQIEIQLA